MHVHDEVVCEVPVGFGSEEEFLELMTQPPSWAPDLPIAANAWRGHRYDKSGQAEQRALDAETRTYAAAARDEAIVSRCGTGVRPKHRMRVCRDEHRREPIRHPQPGEAGDDGSSR